MFLIILSLTKIYNLTTLSVVGSTILSGFPNSSFPSRLSFLLIVPTTLLLGG
jgi:hypothetical protein